MKNRFVQVAVLLASISMLSGYVYSGQVNSVKPNKSCTKIEAEKPIHLESLKGISTVKDIGLLSLVSSEGKRLEVSKISNELVTEDSQTQEESIQKPDKEGSEDAQPTQQETIETSESSTQEIEEPETETETPITEENTEDTEEIIGEVETKGYGICETEGDIDYSYVQSVEDRLSCLPSYMVEAFVNSGWHYYLTNSDLATQSGKQVGTVLGHTSYTEQLIYVEANNYAISDSVLHEFGHYWDCRCGFPSESTEFEDICSEEWDTYISELAPNSAYSSNRELFADSFEYYFTDSNRLASVCPRIYEFVSRYIN